MTHVPKLLNALSRLLSYPDESTVQTSELLYVVLKDELESAAHAIAQFGAYAEQHDVTDLEEIFTQTFDINPLSALEVGWHLFGEEYARGMFLVRMREELRKFSLPESHELPDHISHVLAVVAAMPETEATRFVRACVQPAVRKMHLALTDKETPYRHVISCLADILNYVWGHPSSMDESSPNERTDPRPFAGDPLHAYPVADVHCAADGGCHADVQFVPLQMSLPEHHTSHTNQADSNSVRKL